MTPNKLKQKQGSAEPRTPSSKKQHSSTEDGLLNLSPQMLAPNLLVLNQLLGTRCCCSAMQQQQQMVLPCAVCGCCVTRQFTIPGRPFSTNSARGTAVDVQVPCM